MLGSSRRQAHLDFRAFLLKGKKDRGVAVSPAAAYRLGHFLLTDGRKPHRRVGRPRQFEGEAKILVRERQ